MSKKPAAPAKDGMTFSYGSWIFVPDPDDMFVPAKVMEAFSAGKPGKVERDGRPITLSPEESGQCIRMDEQSLTSVNNMVELRELNEASILHNLRLRFQRNEIYTTVGTILVSVNPFKLLPLYTGEMLESYKTKGPRNCPPHVYAVADNAYKEMVNARRNQSCIVSGESGAGKTEATKVFLQYIADVSGAPAPKKDDKTASDFGSATLQEQILKCNPLMEAFGNAKTKRNNNSSRFGKWIEVKFHPSFGTIVGGSIVQYLLEKSRIVQQAEGERNYHIFYNLCAGASMDPAVKAKFRVTEPEDYFYLNQSGGTYQAAGINDERDWEDVINAMQVIGMSNAEQDDLLRVVSAILHLGNIKFAKGDAQFEEGSSVENREMAEMAATQLGTSIEVLVKSLTSKTMKSGKDVVTKVNNVDAACASRDALAKEVYAKSFDWLISRINSSLEAESKRRSGASSNKKDAFSVIGVLDIFGFETFLHNSFEQLCINYCNEKLQGHFNNHIFSLEQAEYRAEGIDVSQIEFADNKPTLDLLEAKKTGVFAIIDEEMVVPRGTDETLLVKLTKQHEKHPNFRKPGVKTNAERASFSVVHYAGQVMYNTSGFLEKNKDKLSDDLEVVCQASSIPFVRELFPKEDARRKSNAGSVAFNNPAGSSISSKFINQLSALMTTLNGTDPHFVRCIKPNDEKAGNIFTSQMVIDQLRYAGLLEVCRIRQIGYPVRKDFKEFHRRYGVLHPTPTKDAGTLCKELEKSHQLAVGQWQLGKAKVFLRNDPYNALEAFREVALKGRVIKMQKIARRFIERCKYYKYKQTRKALKDNIAKRVYEPLKASIQDAGDLPYGGKHLPEVKEAIKLLQRLEEEIRVTKLLEEAIAKRDYSLLMGGINTAKDMKFTSPVVQKAEALMKLIEEERAAVKALQAAIDAREMKALTDAMDKIKKLSLTSIPEWAQAEALMQRLQAEQVATDAVAKATAARDFDKLKETLAKAAEMGLKNATIEAGEACKRDLITQMEESARLEQERIAAAAARKAEEERAKQVKQLEEQMAAAAASNDEAKIAEAKRAVLQAGVGGDKVESMMAATKKLDESKEALTALMGAVETTESKCQSAAGITQADVFRLSSAIATAKAAGVAESDMKKALALEDNCKQRLVVQVELENALKSDEFDALVKAMGAAQDLNMTTDTLNQVIDKVKELDQSRVHDNGPRVETDLDEDEFERRRKENMAMASHERYNFRKFYKIRTDGDYLKTTMFNKRKMAETKLSYQKTLIPRSILDLNKDLNKMAIGIHKSILGYAGEQLMSFPATLAQDILIRGLETPELVDEIYIQLCKHLTNNPKPESVGRAWQLVCMAVGTFPPSTDFEYYLLNFLIEHLSVPGLVGNYAKYSLRRLEGMLIRGASGFVPNIDEILAYKERPPILATIELVDGTALTEDLPITPDLNVEKVLEICSHFLSLKDPRGRYFGIFVKDIEDPDGNNEGDAGAASAYSAARPDEVDNKGGPEIDGQTGEALPKMPPRTPRPLRDKDYLGDVVVQMTRARRRVAFVFKRKTFLPNEKPDSDDLVYSRLMYLQCADEIISGNLPVLKESDVVDMTAIAVAADSDKFPSTEQGLLDADLMEYVPVPWRSKKTDTNWARAVLAARGKVASKSLDYLQKKYVEMASQLPLYGVTFFYVRRAAEESDMICGIDHQGISFLSLSRVPLQSFPFKDVHRWGGSSSQFWLLVWDAKKQAKSKLALYTSQARDMSALILDYALLAAEQAKKP